MKELKLADAVAVTGGLQTIPICGESTLPWCVSPTFPIVKLAR